MQLSDNDARVLWAVEYNLVVVISTVILHSVTKMAAYIIKQICLSQAHRLSTSTYYHSLQKATIASAIGVRFVSEIFIPSTAIELANEWQYVREGSEKPCLA